MNQDNNNKKNNHNHNSCNSTMNDDNGANAEKVSSSGNDDSDLSNELSSMTIDSSSSKKKKKNICLCCLKQVEGCSRCSQCETALYCDRECQVKHWPVHKNICMSSNDTEDSNEKLHMKAKNHLDQGNSIHTHIKDNHHY